MLSPPARGVTGRKRLRIAKNSNQRHTMRLKAHLGGFAIQVGERFIIELGHRCFYGRVPWGGAVGSGFIDFTGISSPVGTGRARPANEIGAEFVRRGLDGGRGLVGGALRYMPLFPWPLSGAS